MSAALFSYTHTPKNLKPAFRAKSPFSQAVCYLVSVQPCAGLNEKVYCTLACISTFSSKSAYGEPTMLLVFMNMKTRRCHGWIVTIFFIKIFIIVDAISFSAYDGKWLTQRLCKSLSEWKTLKINRQAYERTFRLFGSPEQLAGSWFMFIEKIQCPLLAFVSVFRAF